MLKDGYWANSNYAEGQEEYLYLDALDMIEQISKPLVRYTVSMVRFSEETGMPVYDYKINQIVRLYDPDLLINDFAYVKKITLYLDVEKRDSIEISNEDIALTGQSFDSILNRITQLSDLIDQNNSLYGRADAISPSGTILAERLNGTINILRNRLQSSKSSWYTDDDGNLMFESVSGEAAMMLCGEGFMIASGRDAEGRWNWRTFGTGEGFTADAITTGFLSAKRIEAGSITLLQLDPNIGTSISLSDNASITAINGTIQQVASSVASSIEDLNGRVSNNQTAITQTAESITTTVTSIENISGNLNNYISRVETYQRFSEEG